MFLCVCVCKDERNVLKFYPEWKYQRVSVLVEDGMRFLVAISGEIPL